MPRRGSSLNEDSSRDESGDGKPTREKDRYLDRVEVLNFVFFLHRRRFRLRRGNRGGGGGAPSFFPFDPDPIGQKLLFTDILSIAADGFSGPSDDGSGMCFSPDP